MNECTINCTGCQDCLLQLLQEMSPDADQLWLTLGGIGTDVERNGDAYTIAAGFSLYADRTIEDALIILLALCA